MNIMNMKSRPVFRPLMFLVSVIFFSSCSGGELSPTPVSIDLSDARALFTVSESSSSGLTLKDTSSEEALGQLRKILSDGTVQSVIYEDSSGDQVVSDVVPTSVFVGPDSKVYITFGGRGVLIAGELCFLVRGSLDGTPECFGSTDGVGSDGVGELDFIPGNNGDMNLFRPRNNFDGNNNFHFISYDMASSKYIFRSLSPDGVVSDGIEMSIRDVRLYGFAVGNDGTIFFGGQTVATGQFFIRRTTGAGGVENLPVDAGLDTDFIVSSTGDLFLEDSSRVTRGSPLGTEISYEEISLTNVLSALFLDQGQLSGLVDSASYSSSTRRVFLEDALGNIYYLYSSVGLVKVYPGNPVTVTNSENTVTLARTSGNYLYYAGTDATNQNIFRRIDLTDETFPETDLLNGEDIEVYRFQVWSNGNILFGGLRLSDNQLILGEINGETLELTVRTTTTTRIDELVLIE